MKKTMGIVEKVKIIGVKSTSSYAVFDTGARTTSVDVRMASRAGLGPITGVVRVKNPSVKSHSRRPLVLAKVEIDGKEFEREINIQDRSHMNFPIIIGRDILAGNFIVDPQKNLDIFKRRDKEEKESRKFK